MVGGGGVSPSRPCLQYQGAKRDGGEGRGVAVGVRLLIRLSHMLPTHTHPHQPTGNSNSVKPQGEFCNVFNFSTIFTQATFGIVFCIRSVCFPLFSNTVKDLIILFRTLFKIVATVRNRTQLFRTLPRVFERRLRKRYITKPAVERFQSVLLPLKTTASVTRPFPK